MKSVIQKLGMLITILWASLTASAYDFSVGGIYYTITSMADLEVCVSNWCTFANGTSSYQGIVTIPESVDYNNRTFTVTAIGYQAFYNSKATKVFLPSTIREIGNSAFTGSDDLISISLPDTQLEIGSYAFSSCKSIESFIIPKGVTQVGVNAFSYCDKLIEVFCLGANKPKGLSTSTFSNAHDFLEIYVPSTKIYGFGREYVSFTSDAYDYTGQSHNIEWTNNLRAYRCEILNSDCITEVNAGGYSKNLKATYSDGVNFSIEIPYEYTITKAPLTLTVNDSQREYGEPNPTFTCDISGFVNGESLQSIGVLPSFECEATEKSKVGDYQVSASLNAPNYDITYKDGTLSIVKAPLIATVNDLLMSYGDENPQFTLSSPDLKNGETIIEWTILPKFSTTAGASSAVGSTHTVSASDGVAINYDITKYNPGTITIVKRDLVAMANCCERLYGEENPVFEISYMGFVNGDSYRSLTELPIAKCAASESSDIGTYPITVSGGEAENYNFVYKDGYLKVNPLTVGFKNTYNSVKYLDMSVSSNDRYFNYIPEIAGPFSEEYFDINLFFLDKDNKYPTKHVMTIAGGEYAGNYVRTNADCTMWAGKYILDITSKNRNPNVIANPSRAYATINQTSNNLEWDAESTILVKVGETVDLGISYQADLWCTFNTDYNEDLIALSAERKTETNPHWYVTGLKEGETTLSFGIECNKNDMGFYNFVTKSPLSRRIKVEPSSGIEDVLPDSNPVLVVVQEASVYIYHKKKMEKVRVFNIQGAIVTETSDDVIQNLPKGIYIVLVGSQSYKVKI